MKRVRITVRHNPTDPVDDLRLAARMRRDLWAHSKVEIDPGSPRHETNRDEKRNAYFEFATDQFPEVQRVIQEYGYSDRAEATVLQETEGMECVNCGNLTPKMSAVCPICQFKDIAPCPYCDREVPRLDYIQNSWDVFTCPLCNHRVRMQFQDQHYESDGEYNQPLVLVVPAEAPQ